MRVYKSFIRPVITYSTETDILTQQAKKLLKNFEIEQKVEGEDVVKYIKAQRVRWIGNIW